MPSVLDIPGMGPYLATRQQMVGEDAQRQQQAIGIMGLIGQMEDRDAKRAMAPLQQRLLAAQAADAEQKPDDRVQARENTKQIALARLQQAATTAETTHQFRLSQLTRQQDRDAEIARHNLVREGINQEAVGIAGQRLFYDTGMRPAGAAPQPVAPAVPSAPVRETAPNDQAALSRMIALDQSGQQGSVTGPVPANGAPVAQPVSMPQSQPEMPVSLASMYGAEARFPAVGLPPAGNLVPGMSGAPQPAAPAAPQTPVMPPHIASAPRKVQDAWKLQQTKTSAAGPTPGDFSKTGQAFLDSLPESDRAFIKKVAAYEIDPKTLSTRGGHREEVLKHAAQFDPTFDQKNYNTISTAVNKFATGPQGNTVRSLNVAIEHMDTLQTAANALKNGSFTPANKVYNEVAKIFGAAPPNTFEGLRDIVANEVVKGTIGTAGAMEDRSQAAAKIKAQSSPQQLSELLAGWRELMGGQMKGLERQYEGATSRHDFRERYLTPRTREALDVTPQRRASDATPVRKYNPATGRLE